MLLFVLNHLRSFHADNRLYSGIQNDQEIQKTIEPLSALALWAVMCASAGNQNPPDRGPANAAWLTRPQVDAMLELEESAHSVCIHIVRHRRPAQANGVLQNFAQCKPQPLQLRPGQPARPASRPYTGTKQA